MKNKFWLSGVLVLLLGIAFVGCQSDAQRIRATNEALNPPAATNTPVPRATATNTPLIAEIQAINIQKGDCIVSTLPEGIRIDTVEIVPCTDMWEYRALSLFEVATTARGYPDEDFFTQQAYESCEQESTFFLYPLEDSWRYGDRTVTCLQESFGLSVTNPEKLDRLVSQLYLIGGECFNNAPETGGLLVELVDCSTEWEYRVTNRFELDESGSFPGEEYIDQQAYERCKEPYDWYFPPSSESWQLGDRAVLCVEEGF